MAHDHCAAARAQRQRRAQPATPDELDASDHRDRPRVEDLAIEDESAIDAPSTPQRFAERRVIDVTQIAPKPDQNRIHHGLPLCQPPPPIKIRPCKAST
jgi:hypothetical protein